MYTILTGLFFSIIGFENQGALFPRRVSHREIRGNEQLEKHQWPPIKS